MVALEAAAAIQGGLRQAFQVSPWQVMSSGLEGIGMNIRSDGIPEGDSWIG